MDPSISHGLVHIINICEIIYIYIYIYIYMYIYIAVADTHVYDRRYTH